MDRIGLTFDEFVELAQAKGRRGPGVSRGGGDGAAGDGSDGPDCRVQRPVVAGLRVPPGGGLWRLTLTVSATASQLDVAFNDGAGHWDNNSGQDWHVAISGGLPDWVMDGALDATAALVAQNGVMKLYAEYRDGTLYVAGESWRKPDQSACRRSAGAPQANRAWRGAARIGLGIVRY